MPELPEVETVMRGLSPHMEGQAFERVDQRRPDLRFALPDEFSARLSGTRILGLSRRAKYILVKLSSGETLVMHLGMSGRFTVNGTLGGTDPRHDHVVFHLSNGDVVAYNDPRRFGYMDLVTSLEIERHKFFASLGPEPLSNSFNGGVLAEKALGRKTPIKSFLLDQRVVAGLGNIYVLEALFRIGVNPSRAASLLVTRGGKARPIADELASAVRDVLREAIASGGSSLKDYAKADGSMGYFQHKFQVYGRAGEACLRAGCPGEIERVVQAGRSSFFCPCCQK